MARAGKGKQEKGVRRWALLAVVLVGFCMASWWTYYFVRSRSSGAEEIDPDQDGSTVKQIHSEYARVFGLIQLREQERIKSAGLKPKRQHWLDFVEEQSKQEREQPRTSRKKAALLKENTCYFKKSVQCSGDRDTTIAIEQWRQGEVSNLCASTPDARSKIKAYDSSSSSSSNSKSKSRNNRFFAIENAMLNFKKVHLNNDNKKKKDKAPLSLSSASPPSASESRVSWEVGFLAAQCGDFGKEDIGLPLYMPDISDQQCDYGLNETVLVYSLQVSWILEEL